VGIEVEDHLIGQVLGQLPILAAHCLGRLEDGLGDLLAVEVDDVAVALLDEMEHPGG